MLISFYLGVWITHFVNHSPLIGRNGSGKSTLLKLILILASAPEYNLDVRDFAFEGRKNKRSTGST